jgi:hypothetical protein
MYTLRPTGNRAVRFSANLSNLDARCKSSTYKSLWGYSELQSLKNWLEHRLRSISCQPASTLYFFRADVMSFKFLVSNMFLL